MPVLFFLGPKINCFIDIAVTLLGQFRCKFQLKENIHYLHDAGGALGQRRYENLFGSGDRRTLPFLLDDEYPFTIGDEDRRLERPRCLSGELDDNFLFLSPLFVPFGGEDRRLERPRCLSGEFDENFLFLSPLLFASLALSLTAAGVTEGVGFTPVPGDKSLPDAD